MTSRREYSAERIAGYASLRSKCESNDSDPFIILRCSIDDEVAVDWTSLHVQSACRPRPR